MTRALFPLLALALAGCASTGGLAPRSSPTAAQSLDSAKSLAQAKLSPARWPAGDWWKSFGDEELDRLIDEALAGNPGGRIAQARLDKALALAQTARGALAPGASASASANRQRYSGNGIFPPPIAGATFNQYQLGVDFSYDLDLWGKNRALYEAALGQAHAAEVDLFAARLAVSVALAQAYVHLGDVLDQLDLARKTLEQREAVERLTRQRVSAGLDSKVELRQVEALIPQARERIAALEGEEATVRHQLAALLGKGPDRGLDIARPRLARLPLELPSTLPADLLGRRPDVVAQRWRVEAARRNIAAAKAEFYPDVNLMALVGLQSISLSKLVSAGSAVPSAGAAVRLPIFDAGTLRGQLAATNADYDVAVEQYNETLLGGLRQVVDAVSSARALESQRSEAESALASLEEAYRLVLQRYQGGLGTFLQVLSVEAQLVQERSVAADLRARELEQSINLIRALGGGYRGAS